MTASERDSDVMRDRLDDLVLARLVGARGSARRVDQLATATKRFAPGSFDHSAWRELVEAARQRLAGAGAIDATGAPAGTAAEVWARLGSRTAVPWQRLVERVIPGLALGIAATDTRAHARLSDRDAWAAAIFGRSTGLWPEGLPPTLAQVCDACVWSRLGLAGEPKRTPPKVRAH